MPVVTIASATASTSTAAATTSIIIALDASALDLIGMAVLAQAVIGGLSTIVYAAGVTVTKGCLTSRMLAICQDRLAQYRFTAVLMVEGRREGGCERRHTLLISLEATSSSTAATTLIVSAAFFSGSCARSIALAAPLDGLVGYFSWGRRFLV